MRREPLVLATMLGVAVYATFVLFQGYLGSFIIAMVLATATHSFYVKICKYVRNPVVGAVAMLLLMMVVLFVPLGYLVFKSVALASQIDLGLVQARVVEVAKLGEDLLARTPGIQERVMEFYTNLDLASISKTIFGYVGLITAKSASLVKDTLFIILFYFFLLIYGKEMVHYVFKTVPLSQANTDTLIKETSITVRSLFYSLFITAFLQGALFGILVFFYDLNALYLGLLYGIASMIPVVGGMLVWIPVGLYAYLNLSTSAAVVIALYSALVLGTLVDNFARPVVVSWVNKHLLGQARGMNEVLVFFAMIAGIGMFGFFGIILGPTIVAMLLSLMRLVQLYQAE
ncbi:MAG: AI-2E family transporter [Campylobacterales bacterium]|nr:AI-2E family transporter [Campylobacterales bacterium]